MAVGSVSVGMAVERRGQGGKTRGGSRRSETGYPHKVRKGSDKRVQLIERQTWVCQGNKPEPVYRASGAHRSATAQHFSFIPSSAPLPPMSSSLC